MSDKKLPSAFSTDELISSLTEAIEHEKGNLPLKTTELVLNVSDAVRFMLINKLSPGAHPVRTKLLYKLYCSWSEDPAGARGFTDELYKYLPNGLIRGIPHVYINQSAFKLGELTETIKDEHKLDKTKSKRSQRHFDSFLAHYGITAGTTYVPYQGLYHLYDKWSHQISKKHPFGYESLAQMCALYFDKKRIGVDRGMWFGVSDNIKEHITKQQLEEIKHGQKKLRKKAIEAAKKNKEKAKK